MRQKVIEGRGKRASEIRFYEGGWACLTCAMSNPSRPPLLVAWSPEVHQKREWVIKAQE
jgi:hypothetical protein